MDQRRPQGIDAPPKGMDSVPGRRDRGKAAHEFPDNFAAHYQSLKEQTLQGSIDAPGKQRLALYGPQDPALDGTMPSSSVRALLLPKEAGYGLQGTESEME